MNRILSLVFFLVLTASLAEAQLTGPFSGGGSGGLSGTESTFVGLPASPQPGTLVTVTNTDGTGCNGDGATRLLCEWNGSAWVVVGNGTVTSTGGDVFGPASAIDGKAVLFDGVSGKLLKQSNLTGLIKQTAGLPSVATAGTDYYAPGSTDVAVADGGTGSSTAAGARTNLGLVIGTDVLAPSGTAALATALAATPTLCSPGDAARGILPSGNATGCFTPAGGGGTGLTGLVAEYGLIATGATTAGPSALIREASNQLLLGSQAGKTWRPILTAAPAGESLVLFPFSAYPTIPGAVDCAPGTFFNSLSATTGLFACGAPSGGSGGSAPGGVLTNLQYRVNATTLGGILRTATDGTNVLIEADGLRVTSPWITDGIKDSLGGVLLSFPTPPAGAVDGLSISGAATANPSTVALDAYGGSASISVRIAPKGPLGVLCVGPCSAGQQSGTVWYGSAKQDGVTAGHLTFAVPSTFTDYTWQWPSTVGTLGYTLRSGGGVGPNTWAPEAGGGTVTDIGLTSTIGVITITGATSPIDSSGTYNLTVTGTSGGVPCFTSASTLSSSSLLAAGLPVLGGGAGVCPSTGTRTGNQTKYVTWEGALTPGMQVGLNASGNLESSPYALGIGGSGAGDVTAPANFGVINRVIVADTTAKSVKFSPVLIDSNGNISTPGTLSIGGQSASCNGTAGCIGFGAGTGPSALSANTVYLTAPATVAVPYWLKLPLEQGGIGDSLTLTDNNGQLGFAAGGGGGSTAVMTHATRATTQAMTASTETVVAFPTESVDDNDLHDLVTNNSRITFTATKMCTVSAWGTITPTTAGAIQYGFIRLNNTSYIAGTSAAHAAAIAVAVNPTAVYKFVATDFIEFIAYSSATATLEAGAAMAVICH